MVSSGLLCPKLYQMQVSLFCSSAACTAALNHFLLSPPLTTSLPSFAFFSPHLHFFSSYALIFPHASSPPLSSLIPHQFSPPTLVPLHPTLPLLFLLPSFPLLSGPLPLQLPSFFFLFPTISLNLTSSSSLLSALITLVISPWLRTSPEICPAPSLTFPPSRLYSLSFFIHSLPSPSSLFGVSE